MTLERIRRKIKNKRIEIDNAYIPPTNNYLISNILLTNID
jgi:predicted component of type VI protein secretion system